MRPFQRILWTLFFVFGGLASYGFGQQTIESSAKLPETQPWDLQQLAKAPAHRWIDKESPVRSLTYSGLEYQGKPTQVFAYYATPGSLAGDKTLDNNLPVVVLLHGGGGTAFREWAELWAKRGYAAIAMDLAGAMPIEGKNAHQKQNRKRLPDGGPNHTDTEKFGAIDQPVTEQWEYHAVANAVLAHSLVLSFPETDTTRSGLTGISWGGYLTCIVAGVDTRFDAAVPVYGCGYLQDNSAWLRQFAAMSPELRKRWHTLWDPSQYLPAVEMPILFVNGTNDFAYPLDSYMKSYHAVSENVEKQLAITVKRPHGHQAGWAPPEIAVFIDHHLNKSPALPKVGKPLAKEGHVGADIVRGSIRRADIHWSSDNKPVNQHEWQSAEAILSEDNVTYPDLPQDAKLWFFTVTDEAGNTISTEVIFNEPKP